MTINEYQQEALRTEPNWIKPDRKLRLEQGLMGLCGESGEAIDILKKTMFQAHPLDEIHLAKELGDVAWYLAVSADALGYSLEEILKMNIEKLRKRYPETFAANRSIYRDVNDI